MATKSGYSESQPAPAGGRPSPEEEFTDRELLRRFCEDHDESAFAVLMRRHGPMVLRVCRRALQNPQDIEDAFQATFLVLVRRGDSLSRPELLAGWIYGVAYRTARNVRSRAAMRYHHEARAATPAGAEPELDEGWQELLPLLDQELQRLPEKYRAPLVLCHLEGKTNEEAARQLGWPTGSMSARLARGRKLLRDRMTARYHSLLADFFAGGPASGAVMVPVPLAQATTRAALQVSSEQPLATAPVSTSVKSLVQETLAAQARTRRRRLVMGLLTFVVFLAVTSSVIGLAMPALTAPPRKPGCHSRQGASQKQEFSRPSADPP